MAAPWVTRHMTVADLLVHRSGLGEGAGDLMLWPEPNAFTRANILAGLGWLKPAYGFRAGYAYDNLLYVVAGEVAASAGGGPYETVVRREVFEPLGLGCRVGEWRSVDAPDAAQPHRVVDGRNVPLGEDGVVVPAITSAAAGGIRCSLDDMLTWALAWLAPDAKQQAWLSSAQREAMWTARTPMPLSARRKAWDDTHVLAYAFGFRLADVDGEWTVSHTGTLSGMYSMMMLLPDRRSGFVLMTNGEGSEARTVLGEVLLKAFTDPSDTRGVAGYAALLAQEDAAPGASRVPDTSSRRPATVAAMRDQLGIWRDPWFGEVALCATDDGVRFASARSPLLAGRIMDVGTRRLIDWDEDSVDAEAWLAFTVLDGKPVLTLAKVDPDADFSYDYQDLAFTRVRDCE
jgi:CubicO group peptidase (beta-lactamase class C family)